MERTLFKAAKTGRPLHLIYMSYNTFISKRTIKIYKYDGNYIYAYCMLRHNVRRFNIENILAVSLIEYDKERVYGESM